MFGTMTNFTAPTAHLGQRRGMITGGSLVARNGIANTNLVSFVPPSFSAGCGGIDLFAGSFSFINFNQFVQLLRNVAGNASGYAFQLAIGCNVSLVCVGDDRSAKENPGVESDCSAIPVGCRKAWSTTPSRPLTCRAKPICPTPRLPKASAMCFPVGPIPALWVIRSNKSNRMRPLT